MAGSGSGFDEYGSKTPVLTPLENQDSKSFEYLWSEKFLGTLDFPNKVAQSLNKISCALKTVLKKCALFC